MRFDWTVSVGNILTVVVFMPTIIYGVWRVVRWTDRLDLLLGEFPPHRHVDSDPETDPLIIYPKGMRPH